jgi:hypothetical protein
MALAVRIMVVRGAHCESKAPTRSAEKDPLLRRPFNDILRQARAARTQSGAARALGAA